jgi:hypothetical protein
MLLDVTFAIDAKDILYQQSVSCTIGLSSAAPKPLAVPPLTTANRLLAVRVVDIRTGLPTLHRELPPGGTPPTPPATVQLAPGKKAAGTFLLQDLVPELAPGKYELSVIATYDGTKTAESTPVVLEVKSTVPVNPSLVACDGGVSGVVYAAWVNTLPEPPQVVRSVLDVLPGGTGSSVLPVATPLLRVAPVISAPPHGEVVHAHFVGWLEGDAFWFVHADADGVVLKPAKLGGVPLNAEIVEPLHHDADAESPTGAALLVTESERGNSFGLQRIELSSRKAVLKERVELPGSRPLWIRSVAKPEQPKSVLYVIAVERNLQLCRVTWPGEPGGPPQARKLHEWAGTFAAAHAVPRDDGVAGACLSWVAREDGEHLVLEPWRITDKGEFVRDEEAPAADVGWANGEIRRALVRIDGDGDPVCLLQDGTALWHIRDADGLRPVGGRHARTTSSVDLAFLVGESTPVIVVGTLGRGLEMIMSDGSGLPPRRAP